jgi:hypothetical protein
MHRTSLIFGLIGGLIVSVMLYISFAFGIAGGDNGETFGYATMIIALSVIFFGVRSYRDQELQGNIKFGKAFLIGLYIAFVASTIYVITWLILSNTIAADFMTEYMNQAISNMKAEGLPPAEIDQKVEEFEAFAELYKNPLIKVAITYVEILPVGIVVSLISALILKSK